MHIVLITASIPALHDSIVTMTKQQV